MDMVISFHPTYLPKPSCARIIRLTRVDFAFHVIRGARGFGFQAGAIAVIYIELG